MSVVAIALVRRPPEDETPYVRSTRAAFWAKFERSHVHDFQASSMAGVFVCVACGRTMRRVPG